MEGLEFEKIGYVADDEYPGVWHILNTAIYVWIRSEDKELVISWDMEYSQRFDITSSEDINKRLQNLFNAFT